MTQSNPKPARAKPATPFAVESPAARGHESREPIEGLAEAASACPLGQTHVSYKKDKGMSRHAKNRRASQSDVDGVRCRRTRRFEGLEGRLLMAGLNSCDGCAARPQAATAPPTRLRWTPSRNTRMLRDDRLLALHCKK